MKNIFLAFFVICWGYTSTFAQITVNQSDEAAIGDTVFWAVDTMATVFLNLSIGSPSNTAQTWDFTNVAVDRQDTVLYIDPPLNSTFPSSTIAAGSVQNALYMTSSVNGLVADGFAGDPFNTGTPLSVVFQPAQTINEYPTTLNTSFTSNSMFEAAVSGADIGVSLIDSIKLRHYSYQDINVDAYGQITTPKGTFNTLRQFQQNRTIDSVWQCISFFGPCTWSLLPGGLIPGLDNNPIVDTTFTYNFLVNGEGYAIASAQTDANGNVEQAGYKMNLKTSSAIHESNVNNEFKIYPNPSSGRVFLALPEANVPAKYSVYNLLGQDIICHEPIYYPTELALNLEKGVYVIELMQNSTTYRQRLVVK